MDLHEVKIESIQFCIFSVNCHIRTHELEYVEIHTKLVPINTEKVITLKSYIEQCLIYMDSCQCFVIDFPLENSHLQ